MRWLADECVDAALVRHLRGGGHDVIYAAEVAAGTTDAQLLRRANDEHRLLLTEDKDFGELVFRLHMTVSGLVLVPLLRKDISSKGPVWTLPCKGLAKGCLDVTLSSRKLGSGRGRCWALYPNGSVRIVLTKNIRIGCSSNIAPMAQFFLEGFQWHSVKRGNAFAFSAGDIRVEGPHPFCSSSGNLGNGRCRTAMYTDSIEQLRGMAGPRQVKVRVETALAAFATPSRCGWIMFGKHSS